MRARDPLHTTPLTLPYKCPGNPLVRTARSGPRMARSGHPSPRSPPHTGPPDPAPSQSSPPAQRRWTPRPHSHPRHSPVTSHVPGRPARPGGPALPPPLLQSQGLSARAAAERRGRDHRPARRGAGRARHWCGCPPRAGPLRVEDTGVGLTESDVHTLLATIGRSSKRADGLQEVGASDFLGQFGIGLLACFVVAERIRVVSRSARTPDAPPVEWTASRRRLVHRADAAATRPAPSRAPPCT